MKEMSMHILDIAQNSVRAEASKIILKIEEKSQENIFAFSIDDDGKGISEEMLKTIKDPFTTSRTTRKVGLGIPLLDFTCQSCGGDLIIEKKEKGTFIKASMEYNNIDRPPMGDIVSTIVGLISSNEQIDIQYIHQFGDSTFELNSSVIKEIAGEIPLSNIKIIKWLKEYVKENLNEIKKFS